MTQFPIDGYEFGLCLTHDIDRPYKTWQAPYYAIRDRQPSHLTALVPGVNPWWQFDRLMRIERRLGVRSACYFLSERALYERPVSDWLEPTYWIEHLGRYDPTAPDVASVVRELDAGGWEVGVHGSLGTATDPDRLEVEVDRIADVVGHDLRGGRQHHLALDVPETWRHYADAGLDYDASLGFTADMGFPNGGRLYRPFDDDFVVFPLTVMDAALERTTGSVDEARRVCKRLLVEASQTNGVMTVLWHLRNFDAADYPGYGELYRDVVRRALEMGAWVGPPGDLYDQIELDSVAGEGDSIRGEYAASPTGVR